MIYVGPYALFPLYSGRESRADGRRMVTLASGRIAEHLFRIPSTGQDVHLWILAGHPSADAELAERIASSVRPRAD